MIRKLQRRFVLITVGSLFLVMLLIVGSMNLLNIYNLNKKSDRILQILAENEGIFPEMKADSPAWNFGFDYQISEETPFESRYFMVKLNEDGVVIHTDTNHTAAITTDKAMEYANSVFRSGRMEGALGMYKYLAVEKPYGMLLVFLNCRSQWETENAFYASSSSIALISLMIVAALVTIFSRKAIYPIILSMERQKQFITDAGHEIKTPIAIISANTDVLELSQGRNEWTDSIRNQTRRLGDLISNLLTLSKMDEGPQQVVFSEFPISNAVEEAAAPFVTLAQSQAKKFHMDIQPNLRYNGDENSIRQLVSILADNAVKYADKEGEIFVKLAAAGKALKLEVINTCSNMPGGDLNRLFDRFYRADPSRARESGGYGIGLSIAKATVQAHKGRISARRAGDDRIQFTVSL